MRGVREERKTWELATDILFGSKSPIRPAITFFRVERIEVQIGGGGGEGERPPPYTSDQNYLDLSSVRGGVCEPLETGLRCVFLERKGKERRGGLAGGEDPKQPESRMRAGDLHKEMARFVGGDTQHQGLAPLHVRFALSSPIPLAECGKSAEGPGGGARREGRTEGGGGESSALLRSLCVQSEFPCYPF